MKTPAHVQSLEALEAFRTSLIIYLSKARPALEEVNSEMTRIRAWLEVEQRGHWEKELRRRRLILEQAQQELFGARISGPGEPTDAAQTAVRRARRAVEETEEKLRKVKRWAREFDSQVEPLARHLEQTLTFLSAHVPKAAASLSRTIKVLADYAGVAKPADAGGSSAERPTSPEGEVSP